LLFFTLKNRKKTFIKTSWLKGAVAINREYSIFLSFAIAGNRTEKQRASVTRHIQEIEEKLWNLGYTDTFNACNYFSTEQDYQAPADAAREDLPTRRPVQDKKAAFTKNGILKIMAEGKEGVNGMHFLQLGIGKIAALPSFDNNCYFRGGYSLESVVEAATSPIPGTLAAKTVM